MSKTLVTINLVVLNGGKYIRHFLNSVEEQTYPRDRIEFNILDNGSSDDTKSIIATYNQQLSTNNLVKFFLLESKKNLGMWPGQEELLKYSDGKYIIATAVDIIMDKDFIKNAVEVMEKDEKIGAVQPKIYKYELSDLLTLNSRLSTRVIDTCGFKIYRSRRITNIGHGKNDKEHFNKQQEIFAVEGAAPIFRKEALESCRISTTSSYVEIVDHNYFWYGDDLDLAWRMRLFGWKQVFAPNVIAWHDRQTTKTLKKGWLDYLIRVPIRKQIPIIKRRLDWRNLRWTLIKNDYIINVLKDLPWIIAREIAVLGYAILFEPEVLKEIPAFFKYLPRMIKKRRKIMKRAITSPKEIRRWIH